MSSDSDLPIYDLGISICVTWQAHSLSNNGSAGTNRLLPRRQLLADGTATDACSGDIAKHYHAELTARYLEAYGVPLCPACQKRDSRRAAALVEQSAYQAATVADLVRGCGLCDIHGFLVTAKNATGDDTENRQKRCKSSLVEFSYALALWDGFQETWQLNTRSGSSKADGQMLMKKSVRSGGYALQMRYAAVGIGRDTYVWSPVITDEAERQLRHRAVLEALRDYLLSPVGAQTSTVLPHLVGLRGVIMVKPAVGRAPLYSALDDHFIDQLQALANEACLAFPFETVGEFNTVMTQLIEKSYPASPSGMRSV